MIPAKSDNNGRNQTPITYLVEEINKDFAQLNGQYKALPKLTEDNWQDIIEVLRIDPKKSYIYRPACIEIIDKNEASRFASFGNFSAVIGKAKSRKSFFVAFVLSFVLRGVIKGDKINVSLPGNKTVCVFFDTEQSNYDVSVLMKRIYKLSSSGYTDDFQVYGLRTLSPAERLAIIEKKLYNTDRLGVVVIDGIRDLISDINSAEEATMITSRLLKWTEELNIHIIVVLHQNKADNNARGHLGTEIINKSESVISVEKDNEISIVKSEYCRGKDFSSFAFSIDEEGLPYILNDWTGKEKKEPKKRLSPFDVPKETHFKVLKEILLPGTQMKRKDLDHNLSAKFKLHSIGLTTADVCEYINYYLKNQYVLETGTKGRGGNHFYLNTALIT